LPLAAPLAMKADRETMRFVANLLDQMKHRGVAIENARFVFLAENVKNLVFLGDAGHGLIDDLQGVQRLRRGVKLSNSAVNQNQAGHRPLFFEHAAVAAASPSRACSRSSSFRARTGRFPDARNAVLPSPRMMNLRYSDFFIRPSSQTTMEATVSVPCRWEMSKLSIRRAVSSSRFEGVLHCFGDGFGARLQHAEPLLERMLGIVFH